MITGDSILLAFSLGSGIAAFQLSIHHIIPHTTQCETYAPHNVQVTIIALLLRVYVLAGLHSTTFYLRENFVTN